jgi:putative oxidoreductase
MNQGLLIARLVVGLLMAAHGSQKAFGWFGGYGLTGTGGFLETLGFRPGRLFAAAAAYSEIVAGVLLALGFLGPIGPALMLSVMIVAAVTVHWKGGLFAPSNGIELPLLYATGAVVLALTGPGYWSLDALRERLRQPRASSHARNSVKESPCKSGLIALPQPSTTAASLPVRRNVFVSSLNRSSMPIRWVSTLLVSGNTIVGSSSTLRRRSFSQLRRHEPAGSA